MSPEKPIQTNSKSKSAGLQQGVLSD